MVEILSRIDSREITDSTFCDSEEWLDLRERAWLDAIQREENDAAIRRKEK
jgi:hypothetical protein